MDRDTEYGLFSLFYDWLSDHFEDARDKDGTERFCNYAEARGVDGLEGHQGRVCAPWKLQ